jgi:hypothetical protein
MAAALDPGTGVDGWQWSNRDGSMPGQWATPRRPLHPKGIMDNTELKKVWRAFRSWKGRWQVATWLGISLIGLVIVGSITGGSSSTPTAANTTATQRLEAGTATSTTTTTATTSTPTTQQPEASTATSAVVHNCRIATLGTTREDNLRSYMAPDLTDHIGPITIDTYVNDKVILYYADQGGVGRLIGKDCGVGHVTAAPTLTGYGARTLHQAAAVHEGTF